jgi:hypothetical protein
MNLRSAVSGSSPALDLVAPAFCTVPDSFTTLGPEVADLASSIGFAPDPEQRMLLDMMYAMDRERRPVAFEFCVICSRQNLKTGLFKMAAIADSFYFHDPLVTWTAHLFDTAEGAFRDIKALIDGSDMLTRRVRKITEGNGDEEVILTDGCRMQFKARGKSAGRGKTGGKVFLDEGLFLQPGHIGALYPIMATLPGAQVRIGSSAGVKASEVLRDIRDRGRKGDAGLAYAEWSDPEPPSCKYADCDHHRDADGCCLDDRDRWRRSNPAMGRRIAEDRIATYRRSMPPEEFAREFMGWWDDPGDLADAIDLKRWAELEDPKPPAGLSVAAFGVDVSIDRGASIGMAGHRKDGDWFIECIESRRGTDWAVARCVELNNAHGPAAFAVDTYGPAGSLIPELEAAGLTVLPMATQDVARAYGLLVDGIAQGNVWHGPQDDLNRAAAGAKTRPCGDGGQALGRKASDINIGPLVAPEFALWAAMTHTADKSPINNVW